MILNLPACRTNEHKWFLDTNPKIATYDSLVLETKIRIISWFLPKIIKNNNRTCFPVSRKLETVSFLFRGTRPFLRGRNTTKWGLWARFISTSTCEFLFSDSLLCNLPPMLSICHNLETSTSFYQIVACIYIYSPSHYKCNSITVCTSLFNISTVHVCK